MDTTDEMCMSCMYEQNGASAFQDLHGESAGQPQGRRTIWKELLPVARLPAGAQVFVLELNSSVETRGP